MLAQMKLSALNMFSHLQVFNIQNLVLTESSIQLTIQISNRLSMNMEILSMMTKVRRYGQILIPFGTLTTMLKFLGH